MPVALFGNRYSYEKHYSLLNRIRLSEASGSWKVPLYLIHTANSTYSDALTTVCFVVCSSYVRVLLLRCWCCVKLPSDNMPQSLWVWDMQRLGLLAVLEQTGPVRCFNWDPCRPRLALCTGNGRVYLWSPAGCVSVNVPVEGMAPSSPHVYNFRNISIMYSLSSFIKWWL